MADDSADTRAAQDAAFKAWRERPRGADREETDRLWLAMWEAADFSWDGLADAGWDLGFQASEAQRLKRWRAPADFPGRGQVHGEGEAAWKEATLQDYWRWSIGIEESAPHLLSNDELIAAKLLVRDEAGALWHVLHRPEVIAAMRGSAALDGAASEADLRSEAGDAPAEKVAPEGAALAAALLARLEAATGYAGDKAPDGRVLTPGARAQGLDAVWRAFGGAEDAEARKPIHLAASLARFDALNASALTFGNRVEFNGAHFEGEAGFNGARFEGEAWFYSARFEGEAGFHSARFEGEAGFYSAHFEGEAWFYSARFEGEAGFNGAHFEGAARFEDAHFKGVAGFYSAHFEGAARFEDAHFEGVAGFYSARFEGEAGFYSAHFEGAARFEDARFSGRVRFFGARADGKPTFAGAVSFKSARFQGPALFGDNSTWPGASFTGETRFRAAVFEDYADFSRCAWPARAEDQHAAFEGARFKGVADFNTANFRAFALLDGAVFERPIRYADPHRPDAHGWRARAARAGRDLLRALIFRPHPQSPDGAFEAARAATRDAVDRDRKVQNAKGYDETKDPVAAERGAEARWRALAGGFRTLKLAMAAQSDHDREQRFYRYELKARLEQPSTPVWEKSLIGPLYGLGSDYGTSIVRPFLSLAVLILVFTLIYQGLGPQQGEAAPSAAIMPSADRLAPAGATPPSEPTGAATPAEAATGAAGPAEADSARPDAAPDRETPAQPATTSSAEAGGVVSEAAAEGALEQAPQAASAAFPALDFALSQTFRPFGVWWGPSMPDIPPLPTAHPDCAAENLTDADGVAACRAARLAAAPWRVQLAHHLGEARWTVVKLLATLQSFLSIVLLFLFALAVRRRFQIS